MRRHAVCIDWQQVPRYRRKASPHWVQGMPEPQGPDQTFDGIDGIRHRLDQPLIP